MARSPGAIAPCGRRSAAISSTRVWGFSRRVEPARLDPVDRPVRLQRERERAQLQHVPADRVHQEQGAARRSGPQEDGGGHALLGRAVDHGGHVRRGLGAHERGQGQIHPHVIVDRLEEAHGGERASAHVEEVVVRPRAAQRPARPPRWRGAATRWTRAEACSAAPASSRLRSTAMATARRISSRQPGLASDSAVARRQAVHHVPHGPLGALAAVGRGKLADLDDQVRHVHRRGVRNDRAPDLDGEAAVEDCGLVQHHEQHHTRVRRGSPRLAARPPSPRSPRARLAGRGRSRPGRCGHRGCGARRPSGRASGPDPPRRTRSGRRGSRRPGSRAK